MNILNDSACQNIVTVHLRQENPGLDCQGNTGGPSGWHRLWHQWLLQLAMLMSVRKPPNYPLKNIFPPHWQDMTDVHFHLKSQFRDNLKKNLFWKIWRWQTLTLRIPFPKEELPSKGSQWRTFKGIFPSDCGLKNNRRQSTMIEKQEAPRLLLWKLRSLDALISFWSVEIGEIDKTNSFVVKQRTALKLWNLRMAFHWREFVS